MLTIRKTLIVNMLLILLAASGCSPLAPGPSIGQLTSDLPPMPTSTRSSQTAEPTQTPAEASQTSTAVPEPSATPEPALQRCTPLEGMALESLPERISNPFLPPRAGSDDPHQGIDLADLDPATRISLEGRQVQAVFPGLVAAVIEARFPYGNAVIIETRLTDLPPAWTESLDLPAPGPVQAGHPVLTCPTAEAPPDWDDNQRSLYLIYAHMQAPPEVQLGQGVSCGQRLGAIGMSGNALNPHLHLEARVGPAGASFISMAHYSGDASPDELRSYCQWRVSGAFQLIDPLPLLINQP